MRYKFVNVKKNFPAWRSNLENGFYRYDPIFEIMSSESLVYWARNLQPEAIVRVSDER
ncbi:MAG: hypothetical protein MPEBLZ_04386 [Candidatus Methanoperedens nitroreducens]|uniref:Uncharacterized protein n=1 Tax=Candidatus Methanoperedens nitratireducens TaxID=1392998 RepID=A0A0P7Z9W5_9EURY|nr:MAG: hypothetical protein MPEBLZ_04386 [Candidatus Methanoperedens sp. BLZ1]